MKLTPSRSVLLVCLVFITVALTGRVYDRRLAADRDDWMRTDSTLTAHTIHCPGDSIQLECPPPWVKWYDIDFKDPETGECIFADLGLREKRPFNDAGINYSNPELIPRMPAARWKNDPDIIAHVFRFLGPDPKTGSRYPSNLLIQLQVDKYTDLAPFHSNKLLWHDYVARNADDTASRPDAWNAVKRQTDTAILQRSAAGKYEEQREHPLDALMQAPGGTISGSCTWSRGLWATTITVIALEETLPAADNDLLTALRERVMTYYRDLDRRYAKEGS